MTFIWSLKAQKGLAKCEFIEVSVGSVDIVCFSVKLKHFSKFTDMTDALSAATAAVEGKMSKGLKKVLKKVFASDIQEQLAVADAKLGSVIKVCG